MKKRTLGIIEVTINLMETMYSGSEYKELWTFSSAVLFTSTTMVPVGWYPSFIMYYCRRSPQWFVGLTTLAIQKQREPNDFIVESKLFNFEKVITSIVGKTPGF